MSKCRLKTSIRRIHNSLSMHITPSASVMLFLLYHDRKIFSSVKIFVLWVPTQSVDINGMGRKRIS